MKKSTITVIIAVVVFLAGGTYLYLNYYSNNNANQIITVQGTNNTSTAPTQTAASSTPLLSVSSNMSLGSYLVAPNGKTLYLYTKDSPGVSDCYAQCAVVWPPYTVTTAVSLIAATGVTGTLATITRTDGTVQLTYKGSPLYYYAQDAKPGDVNGQGIGGVWYVVTP